jgi:hypothetical protein
MTEQRHCILKNGTVASACKREDHDARTCSVETHLPVRCGSVEKLSPTTAEGILLLNNIFELAGDAV